MGRVVAVWFSRLETLIVFSWLWSTLGLNRRLYTHANEYMKLSIYNTTDCTDCSPFIKVFVGRTGVYLNLFTNAVTGVTETA